MFPDKYIVLTGGVGFIGSCVLKALNDLNTDNIIVVDNLGAADKWKNLLGKRFYDVIHKDNLFEWLKGRERDIEAFIHLGACSSTVEKDANYLLENNYRFSIDLVEYALNNEHRFIYASSASTYGDGSEGFSDLEDQLDTFRPLNMYGQSKHLFDLWLKRQNLLDKVVGLKYFNVFGPNEFHKGRMASAIMKMVPDALNTGKIRLFKSSDPAKYKDGGQLRDFIYVKDAAGMTIQFLENDLCGIYNIGTGEPQTWNSLAKAVINALDRPIQIEYIDMPQDLLGKYQNYTCADMEKTKLRKLRLPAYTLDAAVTEYIQNYLLPGQYL
ncbi:MAG: ADP-glyceromanno-heptose 6-epimerase [Chlamydiales bacterium]